jgi:hypothetical protein
MGCRARQKICDFDSLGKMLHQIREWIAALLTPKVTLNTPSSSPDFPIRTNKQNRWRHPIDGRGIVMALVVSNIKS